MSGTKKSDNAYVDFPASENSSTQILASNTVIHNEKTYYIHPIYNNYGCSTDGYIINCKRLVPRKGNLQFNGYLCTSVYNQNGKKTYLSHRFIWEAVNQQLIPDGYQIHHINNDKQDNSTDNLELVTRQKNILYANNERCGKKNQSPQNVSIKCEKFFYHHILPTLVPTNMVKFIIKKLTDVQLEIY